MDDRQTPNQRVQNAIADAKLAFSIALGVAGLLFVPLNALGACYFFMVGAMIVSTLSAKTSPHDAESASFAAPSCARSGDDPGFASSDGAAARPYVVA